MYNGATHRVAWANFVRLHESSQAVGMTYPAKSVDHPIEAFQDSFPVSAIEEDVKESEFCKNSKELVSTSSQHSSRDL